MRARRATLLPAATVHPAWISGTVLVHSREDIRHWRKADRTQSDKLPRRHPSGGLRRLTWAETHPHRRTVRERLLNVRRTPDHLNTSGMLHRWTLPGPPASSVR